MLAKLTVLGVLTGLVLTGTADAKLPKPTKGRISARSIAGVKLDMSKAKVLSVWGHTGCSGGPYPVCTWTGPGKPGKQERATVSFVKGKAVQIAINAGTTNGTDERFKPGKLSKWKTTKKIGLGSQKSAVRRAYPGAKPNTGEAVNGYDLLKGSRPNLSLLRFGTFGVGASATRVRYVEVYWDTCHYYRCG